MQAVHTMPCDLSDTRRILLGALGMSTSHKLQMEATKR